MGPPADRSVGFQARGLARRSFTRRLFLPRECLKVLVGIMQLRVRGRRQARGIGARAGGGGALDLGNSKRNGASVR